MFSFLLDISTYMSQSHIKLFRSNDLLITPFPSSAHPFQCDSSILLVAQVKILELSLIPVFLILSMSNPSGNSVDALFRIYPGAVPCLQDSCHSPLFGLPASALSCPWSVLNTAVRTILTRYGSSARASPSHLECKPKS